MKRLRLIILWMTLFCFGVVAAQTATCPEIVENALDAVDTFCGDLERNTACYGNVQLEATAQIDVDDFQFADVGDMVSVGDIDTMELSPLDENAGVWGLAVLSLQADIPDSLPGQNVTFILFGDVTIENAASGDQNPMQAFYLRTGVSDASCEEAPESGLLVQTPDGVEEVTFNVNGVDVEIGSTVMFQAAAELTITTVEGTAVLDFDEEVYPAIAGTELRLPLNDEGLPIGRPDLPEAYDELRVNVLPLRPLPRGIQIAPPMPPADLHTLQGRLLGGQPPCGVDGLPACEDLPPILRDAPLLPPADRWGMEFISGENCIPIDLSAIEIPDVEIPEVEIPDIEVPDLPGVGNVEIPDVRGQIADAQAQLDDLAEQFPPCPPTERPARPERQLPARPEATDEARPRQQEAEGSPPPDGQEPPQDEPPSRPEGQEAPPDGQQPAPPRPPGG